VKRNEIGVVAASVLVATAIIVAMLIWGTVFSNSIWTNGGSNLLGVIIGPSLAVSIGVAAWTRWSTRCRATRKCLRRGEHPVAGTTKKVCEHHHTLTAHEHVYRLFHDDTKLDWGESHHLARKQAAAESS
jgi:ABC-type nickel/cobalt efflux system permease component RcnA